MTKAQVGTISFGTLRTQDLLRAFAGELERLSPAAIPPIVAEARGYAEMLDEGHPEDEAAHETLIDLMDNYLSDYAPEGCYFGAHEGDGSDFGFWPTSDSP